MSKNVLIIILILIIIGINYLYLKKCSRKNIENLIKQERLDTVTQLAAGVAHEFRNPLVAIKGFITMEQKKPDSTLGKENIELLLNEIEQIETLISEFLQLSENTEFKFTNFSLSLQIKNIYALIVAQEQAYMHDINSSLELPPEEIFIEGDPQLFQQLIINLLRNSFGAVNKGGEVRVKVSKQKYTVKIIISDSGPGIPINILNNIGRPFNSQKENGIGLGLAICQKIINTHNGSWIIKTGEGERLGTSIIITLPIKQSHLR